MAIFTQRSFTSGEISKALQSRADLNKYATGLNVCENFIVKSQGGAYSRPGFEFCGELSNMSSKGRLVEFSFNTEQTYALLFENYKMRVIKDGAFVLSGGSILEVTTPYSTAQLPDLGFTQNADVLTLVHHSHAPVNLSRLADDRWALADINYAPTVSAPTFSGGYDTAYVSGITNDNPGVVTTAANHGFYTGNIVKLEDVGGMTDLNDKWYTITILSDTKFELDATDTSSMDTYTGGGSANRQNGIVTIGSGFGDYEKTYTYVVTAVDENGAESLASAETSITCYSLATTAGVRLTWDAVSGATYYRIYKDPSVGTAVYGWIGDSNNTSFDDYNIAPMTSDAPPTDRQPFGGSGNRPSVVTYYQQRQMFANTYYEPQAIYATQTANFRSLRVSNPARDDDAVTMTISARQVNEVRHLIPLDTLVILTSGAEWVLTEGSDGVLTPSTVGLSIQSYNGCSKVPPVVINSTAVYLQAKGSRIRDLGYEYTSDSFTGNDLSLMSEHLFEGHQIVSMAYADEPYSVLWCVRDDGVLLGLTYQREHQVWGWHRHTTDGEFEYVATVTEGSRDSVYVIVKRTVDGETKRYVERMASREVGATEDCMYLDSALSYRGSAVSTLSGLDHLEGKRVGILADGYVQEEQYVSGGQIELDERASVVHVGLPYVPVLETLDIDIPSATETLKANSVSVSKVMVEVEDTYGGTIGPRRTMPDDAWMQPFKWTEGKSAPELFTGKKTVVIDPMWSKGGGLRIEQVDPLPIAILSIIPQVDVGGF